MCASTQQTLNDTLQLAVAVPDVEAVPTIVCAHEVRVMLQVQAVVVIYDSLRQCAPEAKDGRRSCEGKVQRDKRALRLMFENGDPARPCGMWEVLVKSITIFVPTKRRVCQKKEGWSLLQIQ